MAMPFDEVADLVLLALEDVPTGCEVRRKREMTASSTSRNSVEVRGEARQRSRLRAQVGLALDEEGGGLGQGG
jgi:hypothetical protein